MLTKDVLLGARLALRPRRREHGEEFELSGEEKTTAILARHTMSKLVIASQTEADEYKDAVEQLVEIAGRVASSLLTALDHHVVVAARIALDVRASGVFTVPVSR